MTTAVVANSVRGASVIFVAETSMSFRRSNTVMDLPLPSVNLIGEFAGTVYILFSPLASVRITVGALTCQTLPERVCTVRSTTGVAVSVTVADSVVPGCSSASVSDLPSTMKRRSAGGVNIRTSPEDILTAIVLPST